MKLTFTIAVFLLCYIVAAAQPVFKIEFASKADSIKKSSSKELIYKYEISALKPPSDSIGNFIVNVEVDYAKSSLSATEYTLDFKPTSLKDLNKEKHYVYLSLLRDSLPDRNKTLKLLLKVKNDSGKVLSSEYSKEGMEMTIVIKGAEEGGAIKDYQYLSYVGTNFDLVDRIQANSLFFATNIFLKPSFRKNKWGTYLSLYGNRAFTNIDSSSVAIRQIGSAKKTDSTLSVFREQSKAVRTTVSDNLGAYISGLMKLGGLSSESNKVQVYYSPSLEFVWRRTSVNTTFKDAIPIDTVERSSENIFLTPPNSFVTNTNEFNFKMGLIGAFISHETKNISVRVHGSVGVSSTYLPKGGGTSLSGETEYTSYSDVFFTGRAWITEPRSGITLQAEIVNYLKVHRPLYVVTLSKAINFKDLGNLFTPLTSR